MACCFPFNQPEHNYPHPGIWSQTVGRSTDPPEYKTKHLQMELIYPTHDKHGLDIPASTIEYLSIASLSLSLNMWIFLALDQILYNHAKDFCFTWKHSNLIFKAVFIQMINWKMWKQLNLKACNKKTHRLRIYLFTKTITVFIAENYKEFVAQAALFLMDTLLHLLSSQFFQWL